MKCYITEYTYNIMLGNEATACHHSTKLIISRDSRARARVLPWRHSDVSYFTPVYRNLQRLNSKIIKVYIQFTF